MLVALTQDMYEYLKDAFASRKVKKHYIALVHGRLAKPRGIIDVPISKSMLGDFLPNKNSTGILAIKVIGIIRLNITPTNP
jgi:hypothetical protein